MNLRLSAFAVQVDNLLFLAVDTVATKAKTAEKVGHISRAEAIGCGAMALNAKVVKPGRSGKCKIAILR